MNRKAIALAACSLLLFALPAWADRIVTVSGGTITGRIVKETRTAIHIKNPRGIVVTVQRDDVDRIVREDYAGTFKKRFAALKDDDVAGHVKLARWARDRGLKKLARRSYRKVIKAEPEHKLARRRLGYKKVAGKWLKGSALKEALGLVQYKGKWVTPDDRDRLQNGLVKGKDGVWRAKTVKTSARRRPARSKRSRLEAKQEIVLPEADAELIKIVKGTSGLARRLEAMRTLSGKGGEPREALRRELTTLLAKAKKKLLDHFKRGKGKIRAKLARRILQRRQESLGIIFDKSKYPDANHGASGQPMVDAAVSKLVQAYTDPLRELAKENQVASLLQKMTQVAGWIREYCGEGPADAALIDEVAKQANKTISMQRFPVSGEDAKVLRQSLAILRSNKAARTSLTKEERACVDATNEYRMMFGLRALKAFEPLVKAARGHSRDMNQRKFFDHTSPVPGKRTPNQRCKNEGAKYSGENIAMGMMSGRRAFNAWYTSSGHHRNMLTKSHISIGIGQDGKYWTQNFGYDNP